MSVPEPDQTEFDFLVPIKRGLLTIAEVAEILRFSTTTVYDMILVGELEEIRRPSVGGCSYKRVTRRSLVAFLLKASTGDPVEFSRSLAALAKTLPPQRRRELANAVLQD